ncbi:uncharacterized protein LOC142559790 isoform X1 [Dermacentor variabilis]|uniref:uncharacterized protein LOC142559790 isoform X1 n=1 Tax=Dermacentor variabilis TaxID=34621 RepID=UPI003F5AF5ED
MILICQVPRELIFFVTHRLDRHTGQPVLQCTSTGECATWPFLQRTRRSRGEGAASSQLGSDPCCPRSARRRSTSACKYGLMDKERLAYFSSVQIRTSECARRTSSQLLEEPWGERSALGEYSFPVSALACSFQWMGVPGNS